MTTVQCPFDTCVYNIEFECQRLEVSFKIVTVECDEVELLDCENYMSKIQNTCINSIDFVPNNV